MKKFLVFTSNNARFVRTDKEHDLCDPHLDVWNLERVKGEMMHHWKHENGQVVPMSAKEKADRDMDLKIRGADNVVYKSKLKAIVDLQQAHVAVVATTIAWWIWLALLPAIPLFIWLVYKLVHG